MLTSEQKRILALAKGNKRLESSLKEAVAAKYDLDSAEHVNLARVFEYENWKGTDHGRLEAFLDNMIEEQQAGEYRDAKRMALHGFGRLARKVYRNA